MYIIVKGAGNAPTMFNPLKSSILWRLQNTKHLCRRRLTPPLKPSSILARLPTPSPSMRSLMKIGSGANSLTDTMRRSLTSHEITAIRLTDGCRGQSCLERQHLPSDCGKWSLLRVQQGRGESDLPSHTRGDSKPSPRGEDEKIIYAFAYP